MHEYRFIFWFRLAMPAILHFFRYCVWDVMGHRNMYSILKPLSFQVYSYGTSKATVTTTSSPPTALWIKATPIRVLFALSLNRRHVWRWRHVPFIMTFSVNTRNLWRSCLGMIRCYRWIQVRSPFVSLNIFRLSLREPCARVFKD